MDLSIYIEIIGEVYNMTNEKLKLIVDNNKVIILRFIKLMCSWFNLTEDKIKDMPKEHLKFHLKNALTRVKVDEFKLSQQRLEIEEKGRIIEEFEKAFVVGDSYDKIAEGKNTGGSKTPADIRQIKKLQLKEEQQARIIEYDLTEKQVKEKHQIIHDFISLMPQPHFIVVMELTYISNLTQCQIAKKTNYEPEYIKQVRHRSLNELVRLVKNYF